jgi:methylmalonyl-CoA mutase cobalamin-binding subunit
VIGTLGLDQHEVGAMAVSQLLVRHGYEVIYLGRFCTPGRLAAVAAQEDADLVGVSVHSWEFAAYADELLACCHGLGIGVIYSAAASSPSGTAASCSRKAPMRSSGRTPRKTACSGRSMPSWNECVPGLPPVAIAL